MAQQELPFPISGPPRKTYHKNSCVDPQNMMIYHSCPAELHGLVDTTHRYAASMLQAWANITLYSKNTLLFSHIPLPSKRHRLAWSLSRFESKCIPQNTRQKADSSLLQIILFHKLFQFDCVHTSVVFTDLKHAGKCVY